MNIGSILQQVSKDRVLMASWLLLALLCISITILFVFRIHPTELNTQTRYNAFSAPYIYTNPWYYLLPTALFSLMVLVAHTVIAIKLYLGSSKYMARLFLWLSVMVVVIGAFVGSAILGLASI